LRHGAAQDEEAFLMALKKLPHRERERSEQSKDAAPLIQPIV
jgi:hypothetical protein